MKGRGFQFDFIDQLLVLVVALGVLSANFGWISPSLLAYWPVVLIIIVLKEMMHGK